MEESPQGVSAAATGRGSWVWIPEMQPSARLLSELLADFRHRRKPLAVAFVVSGLLAFGASFLLPTRFHSTAVVVPVDAQMPASPGGIAGQISGLVGIAGLSWPSLTGDQSAITLATLVSRDFLVSFAKRHGLVEKLFAFRFVEETRAWRSGLLFGDGPPTDEEIFDAMTESVVAARDEMSGLVTIRVAADSALEAQEWGRALIHDLNEQIRLRDVDEAERSIEYLNQQVAGTPVAELKQVFYRLIEERTKTAMLAHVSTDYALKTIDPPSLPDRPAEPRHLLLALLASIATTVFLVGWILAAFAFRPYLPASTARYVAAP